MPNRPPFAKVAVSDCLRGSPVRWDGDHNGDTWPRRAAATLFHLAGICPEVGIGMGVPRPPIRLVGAAERPRAVAVDAPERDFTAQLQHYAKQQTALIGGVSGYIFADRSPSCGVAGVKVFDADGHWRRAGRGIFAAAVIAAHPTLPVVDAETLADEQTLLSFAIAVIRHAAPAIDMADARAMIGDTLDGLDNLQDSGKERENDETAASASTLAIGRNGRGGLRRIGNADHSGRPTRRGRNRQRRRRDHW